MNNNKLTKSIMRRVYVVYILRQLFSPILVRGYIFLALVWQIGRQVSVPDVLANASSGGGGLYSFANSAFANTETVVQILLLGAVVAMFWFMSGFSRRFTLSL